MDICLNRNIRMNLVSKILDSSRDEKFVIREVNYLDRSYNKLSDSLYILNMRKAGESYEYDSNLDIESRKDLVDGMVFANLKLKKLGTSIEMFDPNQRLSYVLSELPSEDNRILLDNFKDDYFRYGIMFESLINSFNEFPKKTSKTKFSFLKLKKDIKKNKIMV